jgi:hypothetical protein
MDLSNLSDADLEAIASGNLENASDEALQLITLPTTTVSATREIEGGDGNNTATETVTETLPAKPEASFLQQIGDIFTGNLRKTPETEGLQDWAGMPELNEFSLNSFKSALGTMLTNPEETAAIIKQQYPDVQIRTDYNGNIILKSSIDGKEYAIKPGLQVSDIPRGIGAIAAFTPAGRATGATAQALGAAGTQAAMEGIESSTGGDFSGSNVAAAGAIPFAGSIFNALKNRLGGKAEQAVDAISDTVNTAPEAPLQQTPIQSLEDVATTAKKAGEGSKSATQELATQVMPDAEKIAAAERLGIQDYLQPDHVTTNQVYRELAQAVKSYPGSIARAEELKGLEQVTKRADEIITSLSKNDPSVVSDLARKELQAAYDKSFASAGKLYDELREAIPATTRVQADNVLATIKARADELGGAEYLSAPEKTVLSKLSPKQVKNEAGEVIEEKLPTYALLDDVRRDIVAAKFKGQGAFKDADDRILDILNNALRSDQKAVAESFGKAEVFDAAQATAATYKAMQDDLKALFGKTLSDSIVGDISASTRALAQGDTSKFISLTKAIDKLPKELQQEIVVSGLRTAFGKKLASGQMNFGEFSKWYRGLQSNKQAYTALMSKLPAGTAKELDDLAKVSEGIAAASRERIQTGRLQVVADIVKNADSAIGKMYEAVKGQSGKVALGGVADMIGTGGAGMAFALGAALMKKKEPAMKLVNEVISSPQFIKAATNPTKENVKKLAQDGKFINFMKQVTGDSNLSDRERFILTLVQAEKPKE